MAAMLGQPLLWGLIAIALGFDFLNGLHDAANSIATVVSTRVLKPHHAVVWAAFFNFIAFLFFGLHVANTVGTGIVAPGVIDASLIFGALMGAIAWNLVTWLFGIPSSSSHALIGGLLGAGLAKAGIHAIVWTGVGKTAAAILLSPTLGLILAMLLVLAVAWASLRTTPSAVDRRFRRLQLVSASLYSLGHGGNDAQKTMGIIAVLLFSQGLLGPTFHVPLWVVLACQSAMGLGTLLGGWRIVHTMGSRITRLMRRDRRRDHAVHGDGGGNPGLDDAHHHRRDRRRRRVAAALGGALERRGEHRRRLGADAAGVGCGGCDLLLGGAIGEPSSSIAIRSVRACREPIACVAFEAASRQARSERRRGRL